MDPTQRAILNHLFRLFLFEFPSSVGGVDMVSLVMLLPSVYVARSLYEGYDFGLVVCYESGRGLL